MKENHTIELDETMTMKLIVNDESSGWFCRLERWYSEYDDEWFTGVTVYDGIDEVCHSGMSQVQMTKEAALRNIESARLFMGKKWRADEHNSR